MMAMKRGWRGGCRGGEPLRIITINVIIIIIIGAEIMTSVFYRKQNR